MHIGLNGSLSEQNPAPIVR